MGEPSILLEVSWLADGEAGEDGEDGEAGEGEEHDDVWMWAGLGASG